ncbi:MAG TPA: TAXI family TRAP transporter solute-binding subunit [Stellaceae bacterium]|nr:TAXI family TRAP transporter solute-binding subunit [Stellaceae bacterium]
MNAKRVFGAAGCLAVLCLAGTFAVAEAAPKEKTLSITVRAGKSDSPNYLLARQFSEALVLGGNGAFTLDVKESQGTVQNVIDAPKSGPNTLFIASHSVIHQARRGAKPFSRNPGYYDIRSLFPIPFQTVHWLVRQDSGIKSLADLAGHSFVPGSKGSISERMTATVLQTLGIEKKVQLLDIDVAGAPAAVMSNKVSGLAVAGTFPVPMVNDIAKATPIRLLGPQPAELAKILASDDNAVEQVIPKGTYPGVDADVATIAVPAGVYGSVRMSAATAYALTKAFWSQQAALAKKNPAWRAVDAKSVAALGIRLHPGALRYYNEAGIPVPKSMR